VTVTTLNQLVLDASARLRDRPAAMRIKRDGKWLDISQQTLLTRVHHVHAALRELGLATGDRVAILSENRPEWAITDYAALSARLIDVPIYPALPASQVAYVLRDSGARVVCLSSAVQLAKILEVRADLPALEHVVCFDPLPPQPGVTTLDELEARGRAAIAKYADWQSLAGTATPGDLATFIYTSGTTGDPKGVMLTHGNITSNVLAALQVFDITDHDEYLSFLPLCHIFERMVGHYTMMQAGAVINYATSHETVGDEMLEVRPTIVASVPRLYEKIFTRALEKAHRSGGVGLALFEWARATAEQHLDYVLAHRRPPLLLAVGRRIADLLVFAKLRRRTGGRIHFFISGGAPLSPEVCRFFIAAGLPILEGYGLSETSPVISANTLTHLKPGTVGRPIPGVEVRIAGDGEILTRGPHVMKGYFNKPAATAEAIDSDGWFHTGDVGTLDNEGYLRITDRKKDLIVTAGGKNIAPQPIEGKLKTNKFVANAVMLGDKRKFPVMLLVPNFEVLRRWLASEGLAGGEPEDVVQMPEVREKMEREARKSLRDLAQFETPKKFLLIPHDFTVESGELTPTLKVKRRVVETRYRDQIEALYSEDA
jgi:long-chain acyl-CoA synthetase